LLGDLKVYTQEEVAQTDKIAKMKAANADPHDIKQQVRTLWFLNYIFVSENYKF